MAVDLVGGDLQEALVPVAYGGVEEDRRALDVRLHERTGVEQRAVHMGFGREVDDGVDVPGYAVDRGPITDVAADELQPAVPAQVAEILLRPGVGQLVQHRDPQLRVDSQPLAHERGTQKTSPAGDEQMTQPHQARSTSE